MDQAVRIFLVLGIIIMVLYLYANIVPCKKPKNSSKNENANNNQNNIEEFTLPIELSDVIYDRTRALKDQVVKSNILGQDISRTMREIEVLKDKVKMIMNETESPSGKTYMINTNGEISEEVQ